MRGPRLGKTQDSNTLSSPGAWQMSLEAPEDCKEKRDEVEKRNATSAEIPAQKDERGCRIQP
jgi:hypothetical protein